MRFRSWWIALLIVLSVCLAARAEPAADITEKCQFKVTQGSAKALTNHSFTQCWSPGGENAEAYVRLPPSGAGYAKHKSQQKYYQVNDGGEYDNARFGLAYSTVGEDAAHADLFENIAA